MQPFTIDQYIAAIAPTLAASGSSGVFVEMARERTNAEFYGVKYNQAVALMAAHVWFLMGAGNGGAGSGSAEAGSVGNITSKREGDLSVTYGGAQSMQGADASDAELSQTRYGLQLLALRRGCSPLARVVTGGRHGL